MTINCQYIPRIRIPNTSSTVLTTTSTICTLWCWWNSLIFWSTSKDEKSLIMFIPVIHTYCLSKVINQISRSNVDTRKIDSLQIIVCQILVILVNLFDIISYLLFFHSSEIVPIQFSCYPEACIIPRCCVGLKWDWMMSQFSFFLNKLCCWRWCYCCCCLFHSLTSYFMTIFFASRFR